MEHVCKMLLNSKVVGGPFVYQEKRYRFVDDEIVEVCKIRRQIIVGIVFYNLYCFLFFSVLVGWRMNRLCNFPWKIGGKDEESEKKKVFKGL